MGEQKVFQHKFLDIIRYYNEVVRSDNVIFDERRVFKYEKIVMDLETQRQQSRYIEAPLQESRMDNPGYKVCGFYGYLIRKVKDLTEELSLYDKKLSFFYIKYKRVFDRCSIAVIMMSSSLTFIESISLTVNKVGENRAARIVSLTFSSAIAIVTAVLKFKNIKERIESIVKAKEKIHNCQAKLFNFDKELKTTLFLSSNINCEETCIAISPQQSQFQE